MLSRRLILLVCSLCFLGVSAAVDAQEAWTTYRNARFGTSIAYQEFFEPDPAPANGDGQSFTGPEGANFRVYARLNSDNETPAAYLNELLADPEHSSVTYKSVQKNRLILTGNRGDLVYYEAYIFSGRGVVHAFVIEYPTKFKSAYDPTIRRMAQSFTGP